MCVDVVGVCFAVDVVGVDPGIPHQDGLDAIKSTLSKRRDDKTVSTESFLELGITMYENHVAEQNNKNYKKVKVIALEHY